jgi:hypothetical protein
MKGFDMNNCFRALGPVIAFAVAVSSVPTLAQADSSWRRLGQKVVNDSIDRDVISATGAQRDRQMRICVTRHAVRFLDVTVRFANGAVQDVPVRAVIGAGQCSRVIDLRYRDRNIATVSFTYETASLGRERAEVTVFAR